MPALINIPIDPNVPGAYIQVITPTIGVITGVPTDRIAVVGTAAWGPVNSPTPFSKNTDYARQFGAIQARKYDMGTQASCAILAGAANFIGVRVTDGSDVAASAVISGATLAITSGGTGHAASDVVSFANGAKITVTTVSAGVITAATVTTPPTTNTVGALAQTATTGVGVGASITFTYTTGMTATSLYTGSGANADTVAISTGSAASTTKVTITRPGQTPEVFDNIAGTANALWLAIAAAINTGQSGLRGASQFVVVTAGASTVTALPQTYTLAGGADGVASISATTLLGVDTGTRTGMYATRSFGPGMLVLADSDASASWGPQVAFALSEGYYAIMTGPSGEYTAPATVAANKRTAAIDSYAAKLMVGDWPSFSDTVNGQIARTVSPQGFEAGRLATLRPYQSSLNKPISGINGSQKIAANQNYSQSDLSILGGAGLDLITSPSPGGNYFAARFGQNTSSNRAINGDNYSRMIPYLSYSIGNTIGQFIGRVITADETLAVQITLDTFLFGLWRQGWISNPAGTQPYSISIDNSSATAGLQVANVKVQLGPIVVTLLVNLEAGQTVQIQTSLALAA
jgi:hypothetical protein